MQEDCKGPGLCDAKSSACSLILASTSLDPLHYCFLFAEWLSLVYNLHGVLKIAATQFHVYMLAIQPDKGLTYYLSILIINSSERKLN